jgi:hypothetical protein
MEMKKIRFFIKNNKITTNLWRSSFSLPHLIIEIKIKFLTHFYFNNAKIKLESGKKFYSF